MPCPRLSWLCWTLGALTLVFVRLFYPDRRLHNSTTHDNHALQRVPPSTAIPSMATPASVTPPAEVEIVVCRYNEDVEWVHRLLQRAPASVSASVMNHGPRLPQWMMASTGRLREWPLENRGRECHCYLQHIIATHPQFAARTLYVQADACCNGEALDQVFTGGPTVPFAYLTDKLWYNLSTGKLDRRYPGYNQRSCELHDLFGVQCKRSARGLLLRGPGLASFAVSKQRLVRHNVSVWRAAASLLEVWSLEQWSSGVKSGDARHHHSVASGSAAPRPSAMAWPNEWLGCLPFERLWHVMLGEAPMLARELALPHHPPQRCLTPGSVHASVCQGITARGPTALPHPPHPPHPLHPLHPRHPLEQQPTQPEQTPTQPVTRPDRAERAESGGTAAGVQGARVQGAESGGTAAPAAHPAPALLSERAPVGMAGAPPSLVVPLYFVASRQAGGEQEALLAQFRHSAQLDPSVSLRLRSVDLEAGGGFQTAAWKRAIHARLQWWLEAAEAGVGGDFVVCSDIDVRFYTSSWSTRVLDCLREGADICLTKGGKTSLPDGRFTSINGGFFAMRAGPAAARFWRRVIVAVDALSPADRGASMFEQTVINRMLRANDTAGIRIRFYPTALVRAGELRGASCLHLLRVHHCAGCGDAVQKLAGLERVAQAVTQANRDEAGTAACEDVERAANVFRTPEAFGSTPHHTLRGASTPIAHQ